MGAGIFALPNQKHVGGSGRTHKNSIQPTTQSNKLSQTWFHPSPFKLSPFWQLWLLDAVQPWLVYGAMQCNCIIAMEYDWDDRCNFHREFWYVKLWLGLFVVFEFPCFLVCAFCCSLVFFWVCWFVWVGLSVKIPGCGCCFWAVSLYFYPFPFSFGSRFVFCRSELRILKEW